MLKINLDNTVLTLSLDRASAANALNAEIYEAMHEALLKAAKVPVPFARVLI
jgi:enoyl-CoA hydratase/carnithine racemase